MIEKKILIEINDPTEPRVRRSKPVKCIALIDQLKELIGKTDLQAVIESKVYVEERLVALTSNI